MTSTTSVRELRIARDWSLAKMALLVGLSSSELSRVEMGKSSLSGEARLRYVQAFALSPDEVQHVPELSPSRSHLPVAEGVR